MPDGGQAHSVQRPSPGAHPTVLTSPYRWAQLGSGRLGGVSKVAKPGDGALGIDPGLLTLTSHAHLLCRAPKDDLMSLTMGIRRTVHFPQRCPPH